MAQEDQLEQQGAGDEQKDKYLTFFLAGEGYGIDIRYVTEIIGLQPITEVPELPDYIRGIINLRGKIIPVMDVRLRFRKEFREYNDRTCFIVIDIGEISMGLIIDTVSEVLTIPDHEVVPPPELHRMGNRFIRGIGKTGKEVKLILDCEKLIHEDDLEDLQTLARS